MPWASGLQVRIVSGPATGEITHLNLERMVLGRSRLSGSRADGWVLIDDKSVSRRHAELIWDEKTQTFQVSHLSETNLTWLNDEPLETSTSITIGDRIKLGETVLLLEPESGPAQPGGEAESDQPTVKLEKFEPLEPPRPVALRQEAAWSLRALAGPDSGQLWELTGLYFTVGRANRSHEELAGKKDGLKFDQMIELSDTACLANHLVLKWSELETAYTVWKNPVAPPVAVRRMSDGLSWAALLGTEAGLLRAGDIFEIGANVLGFEKPKS